MAQEPDVKPEVKAPEATQPDLEVLKQKITQLEQVVGQLVGIVQAQQKLLQSIQQAPPQAQAPQPQPQGLFDPQRLAQLMTAMAPILQLVQPQSSKLEQMIVSKALDGLISMYDLNKSFMQSLMGSLASSFGKKAGERLGMVVVSEE